MDASMILDCSCYSSEIVDILRILKQIGWDIYNPQGKVEYLPVGDGDSYDWQCDEISEKKLYGIIVEKTAMGEQIGVGLYYKNGIEGISFIACATNQIILSINTNRKTVYERRTDMIWYLENIIYKLFEAGVELVSYELNEYND